MTKIAEDKFNEAIRNSKPSVVMVTSQFCGPCRMMKPVINRIAIKYPTVQFFEIEAEECTADFTQELFIHKLPTTLIYSREGVFSRRAEGLIPEKDLEVFIKEVSA